MESERGMRGTDPLQLEPPLGDVLWPSATTMDISTVGTYGQTLDVAVRVDPDPATLNWAVHLAGGLLRLAHAARDRKGERSNAIDRFNDLDAISERV